MPRLSRREHLLAFGFGLFLASVLVLWEMIDRGEVSARALVSAPVIFYLIIAPLIAVPAGYLLIVTLRKLGASSRG